MADKHAAFGAQLQVGDSDVIATAVYTTIANVYSITPARPGPEKIDVSSHDDASRYRTFVKGRIDPGEYTVRGYLDPANATHIGAAGLQGLSESADLRAFKLILPDPGAMEVAFQGFVGPFGLGDITQDGALEFEATIWVSGAQAYTA